MACKCGNPTRQDQHNCHDCHAANMRAFRATHPLSSEQRLKDNCRSYAGVYKRRGKLIQKPCWVCLSKNSEMHHDDYSKPLLVKWMCHTCHIAMHKAGL